MFNSPSSGQQSGGGGALGAVSSIVGMIGPAVQTGMSYANESERINAERKKRSQYHQEQGARNVMNYDRSMSGNVYGTYQTGGAYNPYGDLEKRDAELRGEGAMGLSTGITDTVINATPLGMVYGPAKQLYSGIASAYGSQRIGNEDGTSKEVFGMADDTQTELGAKGFLGNFMRPAHESAIQHWVNAAESDENVGENVGKGFLSLLTAGIYDGVQGISESQNWGAEQKRIAETSGTNVGGTSADLVNRGTEFQQGVNMRALRDQELPMGKYGGSMNKYGKGGMREYKAGGMNYTDGVKRSNANAEVEGGGKNKTGEDAIGEVILRAGGSKNTKVVGPTHEEFNPKTGGKGVPVKLNKGDFVLSNFEGLANAMGETPAEEFIRLEKEGASKAEIENLAMRQEQLAGRAGGEGMDNMAKTGGLKKYQMGTRTPLIGPNAPRPTGLDLLSDPADKRAWSMWQEGRKADAIRMAAAEADKVIPRPKTSSAPVPAASQNTVPVPQSMKSTVTPMEPYTQSMTMPQRTYQPSELSTADLLPKASERSGNASTLLKYAPELALLASGAINAALVPRSYDLPEVPAMPQISHTDVKLDRADNRADRAEAQKNLSAYMNLVRSSGSGPGSMAMVQSMRDRIMKDLEQSSQNVREINRSTAAQEAKMNMETALKRKLTNAEFKMMYDKLNLERGAALADFKIQRKNNIADAITAGVLGAAETYASQRYADAISGESGVGDRQLQNNDLLRGFNARINNKKERA